MGGGNRAFWLLVGLGALCLLAASFAIGQAVGAKMEVSDVLSGLHDAIRPGYAVGIRQDPDNGSYWAAGILTLVGLGLLALAARISRRGRLVP